MTKTWFLALAAASMLLSGCTEEPAATLPTLSAPTAPPSEPTDDIKATTAIVGTVTRGGSGPCYGLVTDDGVQYALYEAKGRTLTKGIRIRVEAGPSLLDIACGPGTLVEVSALTPIR